MEKEQEFKKLKRICKCGGKLVDAFPGRAYYTAPLQKDFKCDDCNKITRLYEQEWDLV